MVQLCVFLVDVLSVCEAVKPCSRAWCSCAPGGGCADCVRRVCAEFVGNGDIVFWLTGVAMYGCAAPMCALYGVSLG